MKNTNHEKNILLVPKQTVILDWYDGIVTALIKFNSVEYWSIVNLVAWDSTQEHRVYSLKFLDNDESTKVLGFLDLESTSPILVSNKMSSFKFAMLKSLINNFYSKENSEYFIFLSDDINKGISLGKKFSDGDAFPKADIEIIMDMPTEKKLYWYGFFR